MTPQDAALLARLKGFTPGPWRHDSRQSGIDAPQSISPRTGKPARIALTLLLPHNLGSVDAENANAALIAAAPDLHRIATKQAAEIERLRAGLERAAFVLAVMPDIALRVGLAGTSKWDEIAGGPDIFGALDQANAALQVQP